MDLNSDMNIRVTVTYSADPVATAVSTLPAGIDPFVPGNRKLYAFCYGGRAGSPKGDGCICNECAAKPEKLERVWAGCDAAAGEIPLYLEGREQKDWMCCGCHKYASASPYSREDR